MRESGSTSSLEVCKTPKTAPVEMRLERWHIGQEECLMRQFPRMIWSRLRVADWRRGKDHLGQVDQGLCCCIIGCFVYVGVENI